MALLGAIKSITSRPRRLKEIAAALLLSSLLLPQPAAAASIKAVLEADGKFGIFAAALKKSGLWETLATRDPVTLFVVSDEAMQDEGSAFLLGTVLMTDANQERLVALMSHHMLVGPEFSVEEVATEVTLNTSIGSCLLVYRLGSSLRVGPEAIVTEQVAVDNGNLYVIDRLLWQPWDEEGPCQTATH